MNKGELHRQATDFYGTYCRDVECDLDAVASYPLDRIQLISIAINYCDWGSSAIDPFPHATNLWARSLIYFLQHTTELDE